MCTWIWYQEKGRVKEAEEAAEKCGGPSRLTSRGGFFQSSTLSIRPLRPSRRNKGCFLALWQKDIPNQPNGPRSWGHWRLPGRPLRNVVSKPQHYWKGLFTKARKPRQKAWFSKRILSIISKIIVDETRHSIILFLCSGWTDPCIENTVQARNKWSLSFLSSFFLR